MEDILRHYIIPFVRDIVWLDVCIRTREWALAGITEVDLRDNKNYYRVIRMLGDCGRFDDIGRVSGDNFVDTDYNIRVLLLRKYRRYDAIYADYKYFVHFTPHVQRAMINTFKKLLGKSGVEKIREYISEDQYRELNNYYDVAAPHGMSAEQHGAYWPMWSRLESTHLE